MLKSEGVEFLANHDKCLKSAVCSFFLMRLTSLTLYSVFYVNQKMLDILFYIGYNINVVINQTMRLSCISKDILKKF
jgi:hypothetical protein